MSRLTVCLLLAFVCAMTAVGWTGAEQNPPSVHHGGVVEQVRDLVRQGKTAEAEQMVLKALPLSPDPAMLYLELGLIYEKQGNQAGALTAYKEGLKVYEQGRRKP